MANAAGRLVGTLGSGALYQLGGLGTPGLLACLAGSLAFIVASAELCPPLLSAEQRISARTSHATG